MLFSFLSSADVQILSERKAGWLKDFCGTPSNHGRQNVLVTDYATAPFPVRSVVSR